MRPSNLNDWLAYIEAGHSQEIDLGLARIQRVARQLEVDQLATRVITVAGTNGKGSTIAYMEAVASHAGYRVGCYTSPHFRRYNERVRLAGQAVSDAQLCTAFNAVDLAREQLEVSLTYFEFGTLAALLIFKQQAAQGMLDLVLLEVGLGGRLDAVNIIDPAVAVVTTVALDHQSWLGTDREQIGFEKAGIYRRGRPAIYGERAIPDSVCRVVADLDARLLHWGHQFGPRNRRQQCWDWHGLDRAGRPLLVGDLPYPQLPFDNASTAIQALQLLDLTLSDDDYRYAMDQARLTGRGQRLRYQDREVLLDVAHNPQAAAHLAETLVKDRRTVRCVVGMLADKDIPATLAALQTSVHHWYPGTLSVPRGQTGNQLVAFLKQLDSKEKPMPAFESVGAAFDSAVADAGSDEIILVMGSFYTVAEVMEQRLEQQR